MFAETTTQIPEWRQTSKFVHLSRHLKPSIFLRDKKMSDIDMDVHFPAGSAVTVYLEYTFLKSYCVNTEFQICFSSN
jgi:hypothetical protein